MAENLRYKAALAKARGASLEEVSSLMKNEDQLEQVRQGFNDPAPVEVDAELEAFDPFAVETVEDVDAELEAFDPFDTEEAFVPDVALDVDGQEVDAELEAFDPFAIEATETIEEPTQETFDVKEALPTGISLEDSYLPSFRIMGEIQKLLGREPEIPLSAKESAGLVGTGYMMSDVYRGIRQILDLGDEEEEKQAEAAMSALFDDAELGSSAVTGAVVGALAEPVGLLLPGAKAATAGKFIAQGAATGAALSGLGYVEEEAGETRLENTLMGATAGTVLSSAFKGGQKVYQSRSAKKAIEKANINIDAYELEVAKHIADGDAPVAAIVKVREASPELFDNMVDGFKVTKRIPRTALYQDEAQRIVDGVKSVVKPHDIPFGSTRLGKGIKKVGDKVDSLAGVVSTRVKNISEETFHKLRKYESDTRQKLHEGITTSENFEEGFKKLLKSVPRAEREAYSRHMKKAFLNGDFTLIEREFETKLGKESLRELEAMRGLLFQIGEEAKDVGRLKEGGKTVFNYYPRIVKDKEGLFEYLGKSETKEITKKLEELATKIKKPVEALTPAEESKVINDYLFGKGKTGYTGAPGSFKKRKIEQVEDELLDFYTDPMPSLHSYINNSILDIEKRRFFGMSAAERVKLRKEGKIETATGDINIEDSVGAFVREELKDLSASQQKELKELLTVRFGIGETSPSKGTQTVKNILYASLLGNPISAATQLGDIGVSAFVNGIIPTAKAVAKTVSGKTEVTVKDLGLVDKMSQEFSNTIDTAKWLQRAMKWGGFEAVDRLGKSTLINSSLERMRKQVKLGRGGRVNEKGLAKLREKYGKAFTDTEFNELVSDLQNNVISPKVKQVLFSEVSDIQPVSLSEMPATYLAHPEGRIFYMLKSYMLKQFDVIRNTAVKKMADGYKQKRPTLVAEGMKDLAWYGALVGTGNVGAGYVKDAMLGHENTMTIETFPDAAMENFFKTFGWSEYMAKQIKEGKPVEAGVGFVAPPLDILDKVWESPEKAMSLMPVAGRIMYEWFGGGQEAFAKREEQKASREENEALGMDLGEDLGELE